MRTGETLQVEIDGERFNARIVSILDRRGHEIAAFADAAPPPFTTIVLEIEGLGGQRVAVPLWLAQPRVRVERLVA